MGREIDIHRMRRPGLLALVLVGLFGACESEAPSPTLSTREVTSPAGPDSGEPFLSASGDTVFLSWLERSEVGAHDFRFARLVGDAWSEGVLIERSDRFFVNWADFPSLAPGPDGALWAHWLERGEAGGYDYGIRITRSADGGATWSDPWTPHQDGTPQEHGFVSSVPVGGDLGFVWLDGRGFEPGPAGASAREEMSLYYRAMGGAGPTGPETRLDGRVCDCCQTDAAVTAAGPVVVYRDRSPDEIRDIYVTRLVDGAWTEGRPVHADGWETGACPVNGPSIVASGERVAVAWFTAADGVPHVEVAFSDDSGRSFGEPAIVDDGSPAGRVDLLMLEDGSALVSWLERTGGEWAEVRMRHVTPDGGLGESSSVSTSSSERASGFPRMVRAQGGDVVVAWTDVAGAAPRIRVAVVQLVMP
jgi:hypothetical protein